LNEVVDTSPTIGSNVEEILYHNVRLLMWDLGGQDQARSSWSTYYTDTQAVILVVDSTDREKLKITRNEFNTMLQHVDLKKSLFLVYANKQDVKGAMSAAEISDALQLNKIKDHEWHIQPSCALTSEGLNEGLDWLIQHLR